MLEAQLLGMLLGHWFLLPRVSNSTLFHLSLAESQQTLKGPAWSSCMEHGYKGRYYSILTAGRGNEQIWMNSWHRVEI